jgi:hypothetical protein
VTLLQAPPGHASSQPLIASNIYLEWHQIETVDGVAVTGDVSDPALV